MKANRLITLDYETNVKLSHEDNASGLINSLLTKHYNKSKQSEKEIIAEVKQNIKSKENKKKLDKKWDKLDKESKELGI